MIAGHVFQDTPHGRVCACGMTWTRLAQADASDLDRPGLAHTGNLIARELVEIEAERDRVWACVVAVAG